MAALSRCLAFALLAAAASAAADEGALAPDETSVEAGAAGLMIVRVLVEQGDHVLPVPSLAFSAESGAKAVGDASGSAALACGAGDDVTARAELRHAAFTMGPLPAFRLSARGLCGTRTLLVFRRANPAAAALRVWRVATTAKAKLDAEVGPSAWPQGVSFQLAAGAATNGLRVGVGPDDTTFVIGHELGHAVSYHAGMIQQGFGDSFHQMTACIGDSGALEEGWASFFGAWVDQGLDTAEPFQEWDQRAAQKRRIPIRSIPSTIPIGPMDNAQNATVCVGTDNELRVMSFLWNVAAEEPRPPFVKIWQALAGNQLSSVSQLEGRLLQQGVDADALRRAWGRAFLRPAPF